MARKRQVGLAEEVFSAASRAPWWSGLLLAGLVLVVLRTVAGIEIRPATRPGELGGFAVLQFAKSLASVLQWILPALLIAAAGVSFFRQRRNSEQSVPAPAEPVPAPVEKAAPPALDTDWDVEIRKAHAQRVEPALPNIAKPSEWSQDVLDRMDWKRFELVAAAYYEHLGFRAETLQCGPDGGVDVKVYRAGETDPAAIVQCKAWTTRPVGVKSVRELLGVMVHNKVDTGVFLTTSSFTDDAVEFARSNRIALGGGEQLLAKFAALADIPRRQLLDVALEGDWTTPTCPSCGTKMVRREGPGAPFWGCASFPRCRRTFPMRAD